MTSFHGARDGNRTRIPGLEGRCISRYTTPALDRLPLFIVREAASNHFALNHLYHWRYSSSREG